MAHLRRNKASKKRGIGIGGGLGTLEGGRGTHVVRSQCYDRHYHHLLELCSARLSWWTPENLRCRRSSGLVCAVQSARQLGARERHALKTSASPKSQQHHHPSIPSQVPRSTKWMFILHWMFIFHFTLLYSEKPAPPFERDDLVFNKYLLGQYFASISLIVTR